MPKLPPVPPRQAQNRSGLLVASISRTSPEAVHDARGDEVVARQAGPVGVVPDAAAEHEPADADAEAGAAGQQERAVDGRVEHVAGCSAAPPTTAMPVAGSTRDGVEGGDVDQQARGRRQARRSCGRRRARPAGRRSRRAHWMHVTTSASSRALGDDRRPDRQIAGVGGQPGRVVAGVAGRQHRAVQALTEVVDGAGTDVTRRRGRGWSSARPTSSAPPTVVGASTRSCGAVGASTVPCPSPSCRRRAGAGGERRGAVAQELATVDSLAHSTTSTISIIPRSSWLSDVAVVDEPTGEVDEVRLERERVARRCPSG